MKWCILKVISWIGSNRICFLNNKQTDCGTSEEDIARSITCIATRAYLNILTSNTWKKDEGK